MSSDPNSANPVTEKNCLACHILFHFLSLEFSFSRKLRHGSSSYFTKKEGGGLTFDEFNIRQSRLRIHLQAES